MRLDSRLAFSAGLVSAAGLVALLVAPFVALVLALSPADLWAGVQHRLFLPALALSARTTLVSLALIVIAGTPLAWWLATSLHRGARLVEVLIDLPVVVPPAVVGIALLTAFGTRGLLGPYLDSVGVRLPFSSAAVVLSQVVVSAPFYIQAASAAFRRVDLDLMLVAQTLGAQRTEAFIRIAIPIALPGLLSGAALAWARAIGEFGATLVFAGNLSGRTQTMPLAIYGALEMDVRAAIALSLVLASVALSLLLALRAIPALLERPRHGGAS